MTMMQSASLAAVNGAVTAPELTPSIKRGHRRGVAQPRAVVDVVGAKALADQLLEQIGLFVGTLGRPEPGQRRRSVASRMVFRPDAARLALLPRSPRGNG